MWLQRRIEWLFCAGRMFFFDGIPECRIQFLVNVDFSVLTRRQFVALLLMITSPKTITSSSKVQPYGIAEKPLTPCLRECAGIDCPLASVTSAAMQPVSQLVKAVHEEKKDEATIVQILDGLNAQHVEIAGVVHDVSVVDRRVRVDPPHEVVERIAQQRYELTRIFDDEVPTAEITHHHGCGEVSVTVSCGDFKLISPPCETLSQAQDHVVRHLPAYTARIAEASGDDYDFAAHLCYILQFLHAHPDARIVGNIPVELLEYLRGWRSAGGNGPPIYFCKQWRDTVPVHEVAAYVGCSEVEGACYFTSMVGIIDDELGRCEVDFIRAIACDGLSLAARLSMFDESTYSREYLWPVMCLSVVHPTWGVHVIPRGVVPVLPFGSEIPASLSCKVIACGLQVWERWPKAHRIRVGDGTIVLYFDYAHPVAPSGRYAPRGRPVLSDLSGWGGDLHFCMVRTTRDVAWCEMSDEMWAGYAGLNGIPDTARISYDAQAAYEAQKPPVHEYDGYSDGEADMDAEDMRYSQASSDGWDVEWEPYGYG